MKDFLTFMALQSVGYAILSFNIRVLAQGDLPATMMSEAAYASFNFWIVRRIARNERGIPAWLGYVVGSVIGVTVGMLLTPASR